MMNIEAATDAEPQSKTSNAKNTSNVDRKDRLAGTVTLLAIGSFAAFIILLSFLLSLTAMNDLEWNRYIYLMTGIETITFTAIGWLFGKEVYRGQAEQMEKQMKEVKEESKQQIALLKGDMKQVTEWANGEKEKADRRKEDALTEKERGYALYQAIQQLARAQKSRQFAQEDFLNRFSLTLSMLSPDSSYEDTREFTKEFNNILNRLTKDDVYIIIDIANQLYPELKRPDYK